MTGLRWSRRSTTRIAEVLLPLGISVSPNTIARLLHQMGYSLRVNHKQISTSSSPIATCSSNISPSCAGTSSDVTCPSSAWTPRNANCSATSKIQASVWECRPRRVFDHDFRTDSIGVAIPYGITMTSPKTVALFVVGVSHDTPAFAAQPSPTGGTRKAPSATPARANPDSSGRYRGSNGYRCHAWKTELQSQPGTIFRPVCHRGRRSTRVLPNGNPIEHRLFSEVSRNRAANRSTRPEDPQLYANHKNSNRPYRHCLPGSLQLSLRPQANSGPTRLTAIAAP